VSERVRVLLVDDHQIVREGLRTLFADEPGISIVGEAAAASEAIEAARTLSPDVVILDLLMPGGGSIDAIRVMRERPGAPQVLVLSSEAGDHHVREALRAGAIGYMLKDVSREDLVRAIHTVRRGQPALHPEAQRHLVRGVSVPGEGSALADLTDRERDVLELIARGRSNKAIASELHLSEGTVKGYVSSVLAKLGVDDRTQAALFAVKHGVVSASDL
jgi:DNA-binding NarL/FixJ family response regulator